MPGDCNFYGIICAGAGGGGGGEGGEKLRIFDEVVRVGFPNPDRFSDQNM